MGLGCMTLAAVEEVGSGQGKLPPVAAMEKDMSLVVELEVVEVQMEVDIVERSSPLED